MTRTDSTRPFCAAGPLGSPETRLSCWLSPGCISEPETLLMPVTPPFCSWGFVRATGAVSALPNSSLHEPKNSYDEFTAAENAATIATCVTPITASRPSTDRNPGLASRGHSHTISPTQTAAHAAITYTVVWLVKPICIQSLLPLAPRPAPGRRPAVSRSAVRFAQEEGTKAFRVP
jgi:hypothetical protein